VERDEVRNLRKVVRKEGKKGGRKNRMRVRGDRRKYWRRERKGMRRS
jgi:hypothetical protein